MGKRKTWSVEPRDDGTWAVQRDDSYRADSLHPAKDAAVTRGRELARRYQGHLRIKGADGRIQDENTYGPDPFPPRG